jgi:hypothetical protein
MTSGEDRNQLIAETSSLGFVFRALGAQAPLLGTPV